MANAFSLGPRVIISEAGLKASGLVQPGSRVRERELLRLTPDMPLEPLRAELRERLVSDHVRVSAYRDAQPQLKQFLQQLSRYLGLIGLTALFIGGLGVGMSIHAFMREKLKTIAILKTLGADSATLVGTYVLQAMALGLIGSAAGIVLGIGLQAFDLMTGFHGASAQARVDLRQGRAAIDARLAFAEQIEVRSMQDEYLGHRPPPCGTGSVAQGWGLVQTISTRSR